MSAQAQEIPRVDKVSRSVSGTWGHSQSLSLSTSPQLAFHPSPQHQAQIDAATSALKRAKTLKPFNTSDIKVLLLENVNETGQRKLRDQGYQVEALKNSLPEDELVEKIKDVHVIGIRSKTKLTARVLQAAKNLVAIGCFCIGTNQVDLQTAAALGIPVFNSPFSNSRSVAELTIAEIVCLARQLGDRSMELHNGTWRKVSSGCWEVRGKTLGIVGYGHIGSQLSVLAEAMGLTVIYYDVVPLMGLGTARQVSSLNELLERSDFVTLHVPETPDTIKMMGPDQFAHMKQGSYLINNARGKVVDIPALIEALKSGRLGGVALDVYPSEPGGNGDYFNNDLNAWASDLLHLKNVILTPHIGGSTEEAQGAIGDEVAAALVEYVNFGTTRGCVNLPEVALRSLTIEEPNHARVIFIHKNVPGVLRTVNEILSNHNVDKQMSDSRGDVAYLMADISNVAEHEVRDLWQSLEALPSRVRTRILY